MILTYTKATKSAQMNASIGIKLLNIKLITVLFIMFLSSSALFGQTNPIANSQQILKPITQRKASPSQVFLNPSVYTVLLVRNFPVLEGTNEALNQMEENETENLEMICVNSLEKNRTPLTIQKL